MPDLDDLLGYVWANTTYALTEPSPECRRRYVARGFNEATSGWGVYDRYLDRYVTFEELAGMGYEQLGSEVGHA